MRGGRGRPLPNFFGILAFEKVVQVVQIMEGGGVKEIWTKSKRTASFFGSPSLTLTMLFTSLQGMRLQFEGSQLKCGEGCELAESLDKISCHVDGWSPALDMVSFAASHVCVYTLAFSEPLPNPMINRP